MRKRQYQLPKLDLTRVFQISWHNQIKIIYSAKTNNKRKKELGVRQATMTRISTLLKGFVKWLKLIWIREAKWMRNFYCYRIEIDNTKFVWSIVGSVIMICVLIRAVWSCPMLLLEKGLVNISDGTQVNWVYDNSMIQLSLYQSFIQLNWFLLNKTKNFISWRWSFIFVTMIKRANNID